MLFFTERKASKELQASGLTVCAVGSFAPAGAGSQPHKLPARGVVACASLASTATPSSRVYAFSSRWMEFEAKASMSLLVLFSSVRKAHSYIL